MPFREQVHDHKTSRIRPEIDNSDFFHYFFYLPFYLSCKARASPRFSCDFSGFIPYEAQNAQNQNPSRFRQDNFCRYFTTENGICLYPLEKFCRRGHFFFYFRYFFGGFIVQFRHEKNVFPIGKTKKRRKISPFFIFCFPKTKSARAQQEKDRRSYVRNPKAEREQEGRPPPPRSARESPFPRSRFFRSVRF